MSTSKSITKVAEANFPSRWGKFRILGFEGHFGPEGERRKETVVALIMGDIHAEPPLLRIHSQCLTGDVFGSLRCDCRAQFELAMAMIAAHGSGVLIYEQQEGRGIGLLAKLQAYELQDNGLDTVEANVKLGFEVDLRHYTLPVEVIKALGLKQIRLMSNNPEKVQAVESAGIEVIERVPCEVQAHQYSEHYLRTKKEKLGHMFSMFE